MDTIEKRIELKASPQRVWRALTDHREFGEWFGVRMDQPFVEGQASRGRVLSPGFDHVTFEITVVRLESESVFGFTWHPYAIDPGVDYSQETPTLVEFRLRKTATGTLLTLTESGFDKIPVHRRNEALRMNGSGWEQQMKNIERYVGT
jgi:uncharacterized protein YndB with AHSA1/START domain